MTMITKEQAQAMIESGTWLSTMERMALVTVIALHERVERLTGALIWCSGSGDFEDGGNARDGWLQLCAPLLKETTDD